MNPTWLLAQSEPNSMMTIVDKLARTPLSQVVYFALGLTLLRVGLYFVLAKVEPHKRTGGYKVGKAANELADALIYASVVVFLLVRPFGIQTFWIPSGSMIDTLLERDMIVANKMVYRISDPQRGDIVVFEPPRNAPNAQDGNVDYIKRLVGLPGDVVEIKNREFFLNGKKVDEPYVKFTSASSGFSQVLPTSEFKGAMYPDFKLVEHKGQIVPVLITADGYGNFGIYDSMQGSTSYNGTFPAADADEAKVLAKLPAAKVPAGYYLFMGDNRNGSADGRYWGLVKRDKIVGKSEFIWFPLHRMRQTR